jgi:uncharacterized OB-fold protein
VSEQRPSPARHLAASKLTEPVGASGALALRASHCPDCQRMAFPRRSSCAGCGSTEVTAVLLAGPGRIHVVTAVLSQPPGSLVQAPYEIAVVEFEESIRVMGVLADNARPGDLVHVVESGVADQGFAFKS